MADIDDTANFPEDFRTNLARLKAKWKAALKRNKKLLLKCPNYEKCQFKCGSVGGMNYHFIRCEGVAPTFKCAQCSRQYESRTGLNYHMMSSHTGEPTQESEVEAPPSRPVRSTNSPAKPLLQPTPPPQKTPPTAPKTPPTTHSSPPTTQKATPPPSTASPLAKPKKPPGKPPGRRGKGERGKKPKSSTITIPSIEYPDEYKSYLPQWRVEMKDNKIIKCPNYEECGFKCTTVNGMKYHYVRCNKDNPPEFNCEVCEKKFQCRTGLVWHLKKHHKLVDIHPTRGGGFKGTLPTDDPLLGAGEPTVVGKKISRRREEGRGAEGPGKPTRLLLQSNGEGEEELFCRKRHRKSNFPRRTAEDILQNVNMRVFPPTPKLGPQPSKFPMPPVEFHITDSIPTDVNHYGSAVICLGEEALVWQKMYSDSEDESDGSRSVDREFKFQASASSSPSASDQSSDEDYSCSFSRKKKVKGRPRGALKRVPATKEKEREAVRPKDKLVEPSPFLRVAQPPEDQKPAFSPALPQGNPPPILVKPERQMPALIKASKGTTKRSREPKDEEYVPPSLLAKKERQKLPQAQAHQTPVHPVLPPGLIAQHPKMRQPPPLVKKSEPSWPPKARGGLAHPSVGTSLSSTVVGSASENRTATKGYSTSISDLIASSSSSFPARKETARGSRPPTTAKRTVSQLTDTKKHHRTSKHVTVQAPSYSVVKGSKGTQAEYQSGTPLSAGGVTHHYTQASSAMPVQNIVTPMQIVQGPVPPGHNVMQVPAFQNVTQLPPGMILVQNPTGMGLKPGEIPYLAQGGQAYQLVTAQSQGEGSQKVSVIMNPSNYSYFTQLDGPPSPTKSKKSKSMKQMRERFEAARQEEQAKLTHNLLELHDSACDTSDLQAKQSNRLLCHANGSTDVAASGSSSVAGSHTHSAQGSSDTETASNLRKSCSSEALMSEQLKSYFKKGERARKAKCSSPPFEENPAADYFPQPHPQEVATPTHRRKRATNRTRSTSMSSGRSVSVSPVSIKSPKSPRLVVSPTLFSPAGAQGAGYSPLGLLPSPGSGRSSKSPQLSTSPPLLSPVDAKLPRLPDVQTAGSAGSANSVSVHLPVSKPTKSVSSAKKKEPKKMTSPDLSNLFLPDNIPHAGLIPESQRLPGFSAFERRPLEFSNTPPQGHASFLKKPIPLKTNDGVGTNSPHHSQALGENYGSESVSASALSVPVVTAEGDCSGNAAYGSLIPLHLTTTAEATVDSEQTTASGMRERAGINRLNVLAGNTNSSNSNDSSELPQTDDGRKSSPSDSGSLAGNSTHEEPTTESSSRATFGDGAESSNSSETVKLGKRKTPDVVGGDPSKAAADSPSPAKKRGRPRKVVDSLTKKRGPGRPRKPVTTARSEIASDSVSVSDSQSVHLEAGSDSTPRGRSHENPQTLESHPGNLERSPGIRETPMDVDMSSSDIVTLSDSQTLDPESAPVSTPPLTTGKRKRGRPRKGESTPQSVAMSDSPSLEPESGGTPTPPPTKRKRGRPKKFQSGYKQPHAAATPVAPTQTDTSHQATPSLTLDNLLTDDVTGPSQADVVPEVSVKKRGQPKLSDSPRSSPAKAVFNCSKCDKNYLSKQALNMHMASVHPPELREDATLGEYVQMWRKLLRSVKVIGCPKCSTFRCSNPTAMKYHFQKCGKSKEELTIHCPECGKAYCSKPGLDYHMKTVHQPTPSPTGDQMLPKTSLFAEPDIDQPLPPRRAATQAGSRLQQLAQKLLESEGREATDSAASTSQATGDHPLDSSDVNDALAPGDDQATSDIGVQTVSFKKPPQQQLPQQGSGSRTHVVIPGFTAAQIAEFRDKIKKEKSMKCPIEECQKDFSSIPGLYYHLRNHDNKALVMPCPVCGKVLQSQRRLENHLRAKHGDSTMLETSLDAEYNPGGAPSKDSRVTKAGDSDSDEDIAEDWEAELEELRAPRKPRAELDHSHKLEMAHAQRNLVPTSYKRYQNNVREVVRELWSEEQLFVEWQPQLAHWARAEPQELPSYLPLPLVSLPFSFHPTINDPQQNHTLQLFATMATEHSSVMLFTGGPVWALDWLPVPEPSAGQYVALVAHRDLDETFPTNTPLTHKGLLQLWSVGQLSNIPAETDPLPRPRLELGVAHEWGCIRALRWCPSGCWETTGEQGLPRLGLLGVACSDGCLRILSIPHPCNLLSELSPSDADTMVDHPLNEPSSSHPEGEATSVPEAQFVKPVQVSATLIPSGLGVTDWSSFGQCLCLDWLPGDGHSRIAAGYSNGTVCIWDLHSQFLRHRGSTPGPTLHPAIQLTAHASECRCLAWCPLNSNYLFTGGHDKFINVWDIREPHDPQDRQERAILREAYWPLLWCGVFSVDDQPGMRTSGVSFTSYLLQQRARGSGIGWPLAQASGPIAGASYCMWTDRVASGSFCGELHTMALPSYFYVVAATKYRGSPVSQLLYHYKLESLSVTANTAEPVSSLSVDDIPTTPDTEEGRGNTNNSHSMASTSQTDSRTDESDSTPLLSKDVATCNTHRVLFIHKPTKKQLPKSYSVDLNPTTSINKVSWNPNEHSYEWLLAATNCGLVHLLRVPKPVEKPHKLSGSH